MAVIGRDEGPVEGGGALRYEVEVAALRPLRLTFRLRQPASEEGEAFVPRLLGPLGYFVEVEVATLAGERMYATTQPKVKMKLRPGDDDSYVALAPGEAFGEDFEGDEIDDRAGEYVVSVRYSNRDYRGTDACPVGELRVAAQVEVQT